MVGTILQYLPLSSRNKIIAFALCTIVGIVQTIGYLPISMWIGFNVGVVLHTEQRLNSRRSWILFLVIVGHVLFCSLYGLRPIARCLCMLVNQSLHLAPTPLPYHNEHGTQSPL